MCVRAKLCLILYDLMDYRPPDSSVHEYWSGWSFPSPGDLPDPGIEFMSLASPALAGGFLTTAPPGKFIYIRYKMVQTKTSFKMYSFHCF